MVSISSEEWDKFKDSNLSQHLYLIGLGLSILSYVLKLNKDYIGFNVCGFASIVFICISVYYAYRKRRVICSKCRKPR